MCPGAFIFAATVSFQGRKKCYNFETMPSKLSKSPYEPKPTTETGVRQEPHFGLYAGGFTAALILLVFSTYLARKGVMQGWEIHTFRWINDWPNSLRPFFRLASVTRDSTWIAVIAVVGAFALRRWRLAWRLAALSMTGFAAVLLLKHSIHRTRPAALLTDVHVRWTDSGNGFPSGHTMIVTVILLTLIPYVPKRWRWVVPVGILLMAVSRIYLGLHAPLDVIGGFAIGLLVVSFARILPRKLCTFLRLD